MCALHYVSRYVFAPLQLYFNFFSLHFPCTCLSLLNVALCMSFSVPSSNSCIVNCDYSANWNEFCSFTYSSWSLLVVQTESWNSSYQVSIFDCDSFAHILRIIPMYDHRRRCWNTWNKLIWINNQYWIFFAPIIF